MNMKKLIELCDHPWIQERWEISQFDIIYAGWVDTVLPVAFVDEKWDSLEKIRKFSGNVWLPVGFNPETGNWQVDDLLKRFADEQSGGDVSMDDVSRMFCVWKRDTRGLDLNQNDLILKLTWLGGLLEK